jgi:hypothetical protein
MVEKRLLHCEINFTQLLIAHSQALEAIFSALGIAAWPGWHSNGADQGLALAFPDANQRTQERSRLGYCG